MHEQTLAAGAVGGAGGADGSGCRGCGSQEADSIDSCASTELESHQGQNLWWLSVFDRDNAMCYNSLQQGSSVR